MCGIVRSIFVGCNSEVHCGFLTKKKSTATPKFHAEDFSARTSFLQIQMANTRMPLMEVVGNHISASYTRPDPKNHCAEVSTSPLGIQEYGPMMARNRYNCHCGFFAEYCDYCCQAIAIVRRYFVIPNECDLILMYLKCCTWHRLGAYTVCTTFLQVGHTQEGLYAFHKPRLGNKISRVLSQVAAANGVEHHFFREHFCCQFLERPLTTPLLATFRKRYRYDVSSYWNKKRKCENELEKRLLFNPHEESCNAIHEADIVMRNILPDETLESTPSGPWKIHCTNPAHQSQDPPDVLYDWNTPISDVLFLVGGKYCEGAINFLEWTPETIHHHLAD